MSEEDGFVEAREINLEEAKALAQPYYEVSQEELPESTLSTRIDDLLWSDCDNCRQIRFGIAIGATAISIINLVSIFSAILWLT